MSKQSACLDLLLFVFPALTCRLAQTSADWGQSYSYCTVTYQYNSAAQSDLIKLLDHGVMLFTTEHLLQPFGQGERTISRSEITRAAFYRYDNSAEVASRFCKLNSTPIAAQPLPGAVPIPRRKPPVRHCESGDGSELQNRGGKSHTSGAESFWSRSQTHTKVGISQRTTCCINIDALVFTCETQCCRSKKVSYEGCLAKKSIFPELCRYKSNRESDPL